jgi:UDP-3-O-[3-hydroxymyristoyl] glucosamine N-acyltransferase
VFVAVVDTGVDVSHPALAGVVVGGYNAVSEEASTLNAASLGAAGEGSDGEGSDGEGSDGEGSDGEGSDGEGSDARRVSYGDCNGHGTHIAGIIAANTVGIAREAKIYAVRVLDCNGGGYVSDLIDGLSWVYDHPEIWLVNLSLGFYRSNRELYPLFHKVIKKLDKAGIVVVASAGNYHPDCIPLLTGDGSSNLQASGEGSDAKGTAGDQRATETDRAGCNTRVKYPAGYPEPVAVAASDINWKIPDYSIKGPEVDVTAPGGTQLDPVISTASMASMQTTTTGSARGLAAAGEGSDGEGSDGEGSDGEGSDGEGSDQTGVYGQGSGTSQAAAHVTGVVALMLSVNPSLTPAGVHDILRNTADLLDAPMLAQGHGLINATLAVEAATAWVDPEAAKTTDETGRPRVSRNATVAPTALIEGGAKVAKKAEVKDNAVVEEGAKIAKKALVGEGAVVQQDAKVEKGATIEQAASVGEGARIGKNAIIGAETVIGESSKVGKGATIYESSHLGNKVTVGTHTEVGIRGQIMDGSATKSEVTLGEHVTVGYDAVISQGVSIGNSVAVGHYAEIQSEARIGDVNDPNIYGTTIGDYTVIGRKAKIGRNVKIGNYVTIGKGAEVCDGVVIPDGTSIPPQSKVGCP